MKSCTASQSSQAIQGLTPREPHVDSEEHVQHERRRVAQELGVINVDVHASDYPQPGLTQAMPGSTSLRSRNSSAQQSLESHEDLQRYSSARSDAITQNNSHRASLVGRASTRSTIRPQNPIAKFWTTHISLTIDDGAHRDHLALERTFLGYLRTSLVFVMIGVITLQLFRLQHSENPNPAFGFYVIGRPLGLTFISMAMVVILIGAFRFWKLQRGLIRGKAHSGGWELLLIMTLSLLLVLGTFAMTLGIEIDKTYFEKN